MLQTDVAVSSDSRPSFLKLCLWKWDGHVHYPKEMCNGYFEFFIVTILNFPMMQLGCLHLAIITKCSEHRHYWHSRTNDEKAHCSYIFSHRH
jgi:hypothetical protein